MIGFQKTHMALWKPVTHKLVSRKTLLDHLPPAAPNFHILENLPHPILLCAPKKAGSMTFYWAFVAHIDEKDGTSWVRGPQNKTRCQVHKIMEGS